MKIKKKNNDKNMKTNKSTTKQSKNASEASASEPSRDDKYLVRLNKLRITSVNK
jgi:hypothetical protein